MFFGVWCIFLLYVHKKVLFLYSLIKVYSVVLFKIFHMIGTRENPGKLICGHCGCLFDVPQASYAEINQRPGLVNQLMNWSRHPVCGHKLYIRMSIN